MKARNSLVCVGMAFAAGLLFAGVAMAKPPQRKVTIAGVVEGFDARSVRLRSKNKIVTVPRSAFAGKYDLRPGRIVVIALPFDQMRRLPVRRLASVSAPKNGKNDPKKRK